jgi:hypothetical protein
MFYVSLSTIPNYLNETEVPIKIYSDRVLIKTCYIDRLIAETRPASDGVKQNRFVFEFKCKAINFLDLQISGMFSYFFMSFFYAHHHVLIKLLNPRNWEVMENRANKVESMSESDVRQLVW